MDMFKSKIFLRQFSYIFLIIFVTFTVISAVLLTVSRMSLEKQQFYVAENYRVQASKSISTWLSDKEYNIKNQAQYIEQLPEEELTSIEATKLFKEQLSWSKNFLDILILNNKGDMINSIDGPTAKLNLASRDYFVNGMNNKVTITGFYKSAKTGTPIMAIGVPIIKEGRPKYVVAAIIGLERVKEIVESHNFGDWGHVYLIGNDGMFITDTNYIRQYVSGVENKESYRINSEAINDLLKKKSGTRIYKDFTGRSVIGSYEWIEPLQVGLVVEFSLEKTMRPISILLIVIGILAVVVILAGIVLAYLISRRIIHLNKRNEDLKLQKAEAEEANKMKSQFLANMSHELRTPLNSIIGFTTRVIKKAGDNLPEVQRENLIIVNEEAHRLLDLINNILDYSKMEAGKMEIYPEPFDLAKVVDEVYNVTKTLIDGQPIRFVQELYSDTIPVVSDRSKIKHILINLVSNAIKFSEKGTVRLSVKKENGFYIISVSDEGIGIAPENLGSIFDEFRQVDGSYTRKVGGTGLGLSITKKYIDMLGGRIEVESTFGIGSCFTVYLPDEKTLDYNNETDRRQN